MLLSYTSNKDVYQPYTYISHIMHLLYIYSSSSSLSSLFATNYPKQLISGNCPKQLISGVGDSGMNAAGPCGGTSLGA